MDYYHNYDLVINWLSQAFKGQTLKVLGIDTAPIKRVCSFKPVEIAVNSGVIDVVFEDENEKAYHLEEQRNMAESDLYRFEKLLKPGIHHHYWSWHFFPCMEMMILIRKNLLKRLSGLKQSC